MKKHSADLPQPKVVWLNPQDFEFLCFDFAREQLSFDQPIPDYSTRNSALLESSLGSPKQSFGGHLLYPTLVKQSTILFYSLIKNHPFENGNKRIAVMALFAFLALNNKWLSITPINLYRLALFVAGTNSQAKDKTIRHIQKMIIDHLIYFPKQKTNIK